MIDLLILEDFFLLCNEFQFLTISTLQKMPQNLKNPISANVQVMMHFLANNIDLHEKKFTRLHILIMTGKGRAILNSSP